MLKQLGQSMTEYLVVLGVTGAGLLAASGDVNRLFNNVRNNYASQSSEMNKVQLYANPQLQAHPPRPPEHEEPPAPPQPNPPGAGPAVEYPPALREVYDAQGNYLGYLNQEDMLVDANNQEVARCEANYSGQCVFRNEQGQIILNGASTDTTWVDDDGKPLPLVALSRNGAVVGFAYLYRNQYHDLKSRKLLSPQPSNLSASVTRRVISYDASGKTFFSGYEAGALIYSESTVLSGDSQSFSAAKAISGELVSVSYADLNLALAEPKRYPPCVVVKHDWSLNLTAAALSSTGDSLFTNPSSYIDSSAGACNGLHSVQRNTDGSWIQVN
jgi:hypothetical protein